MSDFAQWIHKIVNRYCNFDRVVASICTCAFLSLTCFTGPAHSSQKTNESATTSGEVAAMVLSLTGNWESYSGKKIRTLKQGDAVLNRWSLRPKSKDASIVVILIDGTKLKHPGELAVNSPITSKKLTASDKTWLSSAIKMFVKRPSTWVVMESRTMHSYPELHDTVMKQDGGQLELTKLCQGLTDGRYYFRIRSLMPGSHRHVVSMPIKVSKGSPIVLKDDLKPGLYALDISIEPDESAGTEVWLLITDAGNYQSNYDAFKTATADSTKLAASLPPKKVRELLRAYLAFLAESGAG